MTSMKHKEELRKKQGLNRFIAWVDKLQQRHPILGIPYAVIKKYGDDEAGYQGALITYYGFLSLFPLLIVVAALTSIVSGHNSTIRDRVTQSISNYFPSMGDQLQAQIHSPSKSGIALAIGLLITLYGAKGVADAIRHALDHTWQVPRPKRAGMPKGIAKSLLLMAGAGLGFFAAAGLSGIATAGGHGYVIRFCATLASIATLFATFCFVFRVGTSAEHKLHDNFPGAIVAASGLAILQTIGTYLVNHQLHSLDNLYGQFALVLAMLFWIALQAQVFMYAAEINTVRALKLWPRSITNSPMTLADKRAFRMYAQKEAYRPKPEEEIDVTFTQPRH